MRVVIATDSVSPALSALDTAGALAGGWRQGNPEADVRVVPLAGGGSGTLDLLAAGLLTGAEVVTVPGADGVRRPARLCVLTGADGARQVWIDPAEALGTLSGHGARSAGEGTAGRGDASSAVTRIATEGSSRGVAGLLTATTGPRELVVTAGDLAAHDAGLGMLAELGEAPAELAAYLGRGGLAAGRLPADLDDALTAAVARAMRALAGARLRVAAATDEPLFGLHGANANLALGTGVDPVAAQELERTLGHAFARLERVRGAATAAAGLVAPGAPLALTGSAARRAGTTPGSGAGGGLATMLEYLGARISPAADLVADALGLEDALDGADLVVTAVPTLDGSVLAHSVPATVGQRAVARAIPVIALARDVRTSARELAPLGIAGAYPVTSVRRGELPPERSPAELLADVHARAARLAGTWRL